MPIYLSDYIGSGVPGDAFRPRGSDQPGWAAIDLRPDGGATREGNGLNRCLLYVPTPDPDARLYQLADQKGEDVPLAVRVGMAARLNATLNYTNLDDCIADLLLRPPARAWKPLRDRADRQLAIHLGGLLAPSPALRSLAAKIYSETWNAADSASLTADLTWTEFSGTGFAISGNQLRVTGVSSGNHFARAEHDLDTDDMLVRMTLKTMSVGGFVGALGVIARKDTTAAETCYLYGPYQSGATSGHNLQKYVSGAETNLTAEDPTDFAADEVIELQCDDASLTGTRNGAASCGPVTDTSIAGHTRAGVRAYSDDVSVLLEADNWLARDLNLNVPGTTVLSGRRMVGLVYTEEGR